MMRMHSMATAQQRKSGKIDWDGIRLSIAQFKPPCANYLQEISVFIAVCGGGVDGAFLKDLSSFHRQFVDSKLCSIRGQFLQAVAELEVEAPYFKIAVMKAQYASPPNKINRYCEPVSISVSDLSKLIKTSKQTALDANALLGSLRARFTAAGIDKLSHNVQTKLCARMDIMIARFVLNKQEGAKLVLTSLNHAARAILEEAQSLQGWSTPEELANALKTYPENVEADAGSTDQKKTRFDAVCLYCANAGVHWWALDRRPCSDPRARFRHRLPRRDELVGVGSGRRDERCRES